MDELTFFDGSGKPVAYLSYGDENTIYTWSGVPVAYLDEQGNVYGYNGHHLGWFEDGVIWDHDGRRTGYTRDTLPVYAQYEPYKSYKQYRPYRAYKQYAPYKPYKSAFQSARSLEHQLWAGKN